MALPTREALFLRASFAVSKNLAKFSTVFVIIHLRFVYMYIFVFDYENNVFIIYAVYVLIFLF